MKQLSNDEQPHDHEKQYDQKDHRHRDTAATASYAFFGAFCEPSFPFSAPGEEQSDDTTDEGANQDES